MTETPDNPGSGGHVPTQHRDTAERVLEAAGELFASRGFRDTTIRDIKDRAGANIAAVNYYFRDKETLHREVLRRAFQYSQDRVLDPTFAGEAAPEQRLRFFVRALLESMLGPDRPAWHLQLVMRELCDPTDNFRQVIREFGPPNVGRIEDLLVRLSPVPLDPLRRRMTLLSVFGQASYYRSAKPFVLELLGIAEYTPDFLDRVADHIAGFTLAALQGGAGTALPTEARLPEPAAS
jgi:AcrR family transcriptional regulator